MMVWLLPFGVSVAIALFMAINSNLSVLAYLVSITLISAGCFMFKNEATKPKNSYSASIIFLLLSFILNKLIKENMPFPVSLFYILNLVAISYFVWRIRDDYKLRK